MELAITINFKEYEESMSCITTKCVEIKDIKVDWEYSEYKNDFNIFDKISKSLDTHNQYNTTDVYDSISPYMNRLESIVNMWKNETYKYTAIDELKNMISAIKYSNKSEFTSDVMYKETNDSTIYTAKLHVHEKPDFLYVISEIESDAFGCCSAKIPTYKIELPTYVTVDKPDFIEELHKNNFINRKYKCHVYELCYNGYEYVNTYEIVN